MKLLQNWLIGILNTREEKTLKAGVIGLGRDQTKQDSVVRNLTAPKNYGKPLES